MGFRVAQGASICSLDGLTVYRAGQMLPDKTFSKAKIEEFVRSGHAEWATAPTADMPVQGLAPGMVVPQPLPGLDKSDKDQARTEGIKVTNGGAGITTTSNAPAPVQQPKSLWVFDPKALEGKTLDQLNTLIKETDPKAEPCSTVEEAISFLSMDFGK